MADRPQNQKPIRRPQLGTRQIWRIPNDGPIIPRLQKQQVVQAIGFTARIASDDDE